jgi:hypothetical protein
MWLDRCIGYGSTNGITAGGGTIINKRLCASDVPDNGGGTINDY